MPLMIVVYPQQEVDSLTQRPGEAYQVMYGLPLDYRDKIRDCHVAIVLADDLPSSRSHYMAHIDEDVQEFFTPSSRRSETVLDACGSGVDEDLLKHIERRSCNEVLICGMPTETVIATAIDLRKRFASMNIIVVSNACRAISAGDVEKLADMAEEMEVTFVSSGELIYGKSKTKKH